MISIRRQYGICQPEIPAEESQQWPPPYLGPLL
jgi:hypothetical protein